MAASSNFQKGIVEMTEEGNLSTPVYTLKIITLIGLEENELTKCKYLSIYCSKACVSFPGRSLWHQYLYVHVCGCMHLSVLCAYMCVRACLCAFECVHVCVSVCACMSNVCLYTHRDPRWVRWLKRSGLMWRRGLWEIFLWTSERIRNLKQELNTEHGGERFLTATCHPTLQSTHKAQKRLGHSRDTTNVDSLLNVFF